MDVISYALAKKYTDKSIASLGATFSYEIVDTLPEVGDPGCFYFVAKGESEGNFYDEYLFINGKFELVGTTEIEFPQVSWNDLTDKPFDGIEGFETEHQLDGSGEIEFSIDSKYIGANLYIEYSGNDYYASQVYSVIIGSMELSSSFVVSKYPWEMTIKSMDNGDGVKYVFAVPSDSTGVVKFIVEGTIKTLDDKYISENIARTEDVTALQTELDEHTSGLYTFEVDDTETLTIFYMYEPIPNGLTYTTTNNGVTITTYSGTESEIVIPNKIEQLPVTSIGSNAFTRSTTLTSVIIGNNVTTIGSSAFASCSKLTNVTLGKCVTTISDSAFSYCSKLASVNIPNSVKTIGNRAFYQCTSLTSIVLPNNTNSIGSAAFYNCKALTDITISNSSANISANSIPSTTTIHGHVGSTAETYANNNGNAFIAIE